VNGTPPPLRLPRYRHWMLGIFCHLLLAVLIGRAAYLQLYHDQFLQRHGDARALRVVPISTHRGMVTDRHGEPLAVSTPVDALGARPRELLQAPAPDLHRLARLLQREPPELLHWLRARRQRDFVYLRRWIDPVQLQRVQQLQLPGLAVQRTYRRYYPTGEVSAQVVGFTDVDEQGQEGVEAAYDAWLRGVPGAKRVLRDRLGRTIRNVEIVRAPKRGKDLALSLDRRLQYLAYRELKAAVHRHAAAGGSMVVLAPASGEVLAMVNQPSYNPNDRGGLQHNYHRNVAVTDVFEPGSTLKPFTILSALRSGDYQPSSTVDTAPGYLRIGSYTIRDPRNYGVIDLPTIIKKSSNIGASKLALSIDAETLWHTLEDLGFGHATGSNFPGEPGGSLQHYVQWSEIRQATIAYGYGVSSTLLQLARAYAALATDGQLPQVVFHRRDTAATPQRVVSRQQARQVRDMLEEVVQPTGTGGRAAIARYRIAGKTGTVRKNDPQGYTTERYLALFVGMAPATDPQLVIAVMIDEPSAGVYYGGQVAAPVFARVMSESLRLLNVPPDDLSQVKAPLLTGTLPGAGPAVADVAAAPAAASAGGGRECAPGREAACIGAMDALPPARSGRTRAR